MKITIISKFGNTFLTPDESHHELYEFELVKGEQVINYELPEKLIELIRNPPKAEKEDKTTGKKVDVIVPGWINSCNVYLVIKKDD